MMKDNVRFTSPVVLQEREAAGQAPGAPVRPALSVPCRPQQTKPDEAVPFIRRLMEAESGPHIPGFIAPVSPARHSLLA